MLIGWDLSTRLCGWCAGDGSSMPVAGAFELFHRSDRGKLGAEFSERVMQIHRRFPASHWGIEQPLLVPTDKRFTLERIYGVTFLAHTIGEKLGIQVHPVEVDDVKKELAGRNATKDDMVMVAERMGVKLPRTKSEGREDAADAVGVWKVCVRLFARRHLERWDQAIYTGRGAML